jgi:Rad3-related DNA helicase/DNA polymerase III epsilon subunit-like protein
VAAANYISLDLELVEANTPAARVIELAAVRFTDDAVLDEWTTLVNPGVAIPYTIRALTGIDDAALRDAPRLETLAGKLRAFIGTDPIVGQSVGFDLDALAQGGVRLPNPVLDTFELATLLLPGLRAYDLVAIAHALGVSVDRPHRALPDAHLAREVFLALGERMRALDPEVLANINRVMAGIPWAYKTLFLEAERERRRQIVQDALQGRPVDPLGFGLSRVLTPTDDPPDPLVPNARTRPVDVEGLVREMRPGGRVARSLAGYEERPEQLEMLRAVGDALNKDEHLVVEAGTGTGKSLAYLLPTLAYAATNNRRVMISTNTINLQDQLFEKDVPGVVRALQFPVKPAVLKGRTNYLCLRRWLAMLREDNHSLAEATLLVKTLLWITETKTGDRSELRLSADEEVAWSRVCSQAESCSPLTCSYHRIGACFISRARRTAEASHVVIVNHALLLSDLATSSRVIPEYQQLVVDEAHHFEQEATNQLGYNLTATGFLEPMAVIAAPPGGGGLEGAVSALHASGIATERGAELAEHAAQARRLAVAAGEHLDGFFATVRELLQTRSAAPDGGPSLRLTRAVRSDSLWLTAEERWENARGALEELRTAATPIMQELGEITEADDPEHRTASARRHSAAGADTADVAAASSGTVGDLYTELVAALMRLGDSIERMDAIVESPSADNVCWISITGGYVAGGQTVLPQTTLPTLHLAPLDVAAHIRKWLLDEKSSVIFTSATLTTAGSFDYIRGRLGATDAAELALGSPFDYERAALVFLPTDIPEPNQPGYARKCAETIADVAEALGGRTLALFTSHAQLRATHEMIRERVDRAQISLMGQGIDGARSRLLERFKIADRALLLGTASFWEGVDVVGEALSALVITRLPFAVPTDPVFAARSEEFDDPFGQYAVPQAILRFKQGFGRLIRSQSDRGIVVVLDRRITSKRYGASFLNSLPACTIQRAPAALAGTVARDWIDDGASVNLSNSPTTV